MEELSVDDIQLLAGSGNVTGEVDPWQSGGGDPDPLRPPVSGGGSGQGNGDSTGNDSPFEPWPFIGLEKGTNCVT